MEVIQLLSKINQYIKEWIARFSADFGWHAKTIYKCLLLAVVLLYLGLFLWDWRSTGKPNLPELRNFALLLGGWAF